MLMARRSRVIDKIRRWVVATVVIFAVSNIGAARAQNTASPPRTTAQLEQLVAPIALYPDALLSQVLMASTYPLEVVEAARWSQANPGLNGQALENAMQNQKWDPSVKALTAVPQTLQMMNDKLEWTRDLGDAFLAQQQDVLNAVQRLRARADTSGYLKSTQQQTVTITANPDAGASPASSAPANIYTIEPTNADEYYVPIYDPGTIYGAWPYPDYAPFYWYPPGYVTGRVFSFAAGVLAGAAIWGGIDWARRQVNINVNRYNSFNRTNIANRNWTHNPAHRGAVPYRDRDVAQRFGGGNQNAAREAFRGKAEAGRREMAGQHRGGAGAAAVAGGAAGAAIANRANQPRVNTGTNRPTGTRTGNGPARSNQGAHAANRPANLHRQGSANRTPQRNVARQPSARPHGNVSRGHAPAARSSGAHAGASRGGGGGRGGGGRGGGRRSDIRLKHDIALIGYLNNGLGFYRFSYNGSDNAFVGVMAQEVQKVMPDAVLRGRDGYLRVFYEKLGLHFQTYDQWIASGAQMPAVAAH
jgi:Protein of unknown function (DUF3300)/Chaperone of endosialidase